MKRYQIELSILKKNILHISPDFNYSCGRSKHVHTLLTSEDLNKKFNLYFITNRGDALIKLDKAGVKYTIENFETDKIFHFDLIKDLKWLRKFCLEKNIDIIHSHHRYPEYLSNFVKKSLRIKTITTVHNFVNGLKFFSYKSNLIIAISNAVSNHLFNYFKTSPAKLIVLYNCVNKGSHLLEHKEKIKEKFGIQQNKKILLYAGRFSKEKGIDILLNSVKLLAKFNHNILLILIGSSEEKVMLNENAIDLDSIRVFSPQGNIDEFFSIADLVILPSLQEGLGYIMLEAGLNKVPFIGSRIGGIAEFIEDGVDGYLFESGNSNDLTAKIEFVLDYPYAAQNSALKLNEKVVRLCNCTEYFQKLTDIYHHLLTET